MNQTEILIKQTLDAYGWVNKLIDTIPYDRWDDTPPIIESNVSWQTGHLIVSIYYHSIMVIAGHQMPILKQVPLKEYDSLFTDASPEKAKGKTNPGTLREQLMLMTQKSVEIIGALSAADLESGLEPAPFPHPVATNKFEALDWNIKHTLWHCGQLAMLKRIVHERFDFGLKKPG